MTLPPNVRKAALWLGVILPIFMLLVAVWVDRLTSGQFNASFNSVTRTYNVLDLLERTQGHIADAEAARRGYLLTGRSDYARSRDAGLAAINSDLQQLANFVGRKSALVQLQSLVSNRLDTAKFNGAALSAGSSAAVALTDDGIDLMGKARTLLFQLRAEETGVLTANQANVEQRILEEQGIAVVLVAVTAITLIAGFIMVLRFERLHRIVTMCAWTGQIKDGDRWVRMEEFLKERFGLSVSHGISKEAAEKMVAESRRQPASANR
jgi:CHASE3 domain sensor protein